MRSCPKILLFDDDIMDMKKLVAILEKEGCEVQVASNEMEAVNLLGCWHYDVAVISIKKQVFREKIGTQIIKFCQSINCEYILMSQAPEKVYKGTNGHDVLDSHNSTSVMTRILGKMRVAG